MLRQLSIRNIVLIDQCSLNFERGLCVLTGETGAGKSILLDALGLVLGQRAESRLLRAGEEQGGATAEFDISHNGAARQLLKELELESEDTVILRRTIGADGKTRCFLNDEPITLAALKKLGETLVEIHGQHDQKGLLDSAVHYQFLDAYGGLDAERTKLGAAYQQWRDARNSLQQLLEAIERDAREQEYLRFSYTELSKLAPEAGEEEALAEKRTRMMQGEKLASTLAEALSELSGDSAAEAALRDAHRLLTRSSLPIAAEAFAPVIASIERAQVEINDAIAGLETLQKEGLYDPLQLERLEDRLFALRGAARKYNVAPDALHALVEAMHGKLETLDHQGERRAELEKRVAETREKYSVLADSLSKARAKSAIKLEKAVLGELAPLKMEKTQFKVVVELLPENEWSVRGKDAVRFEAATNPGSPLSSLAKIASGGELSRFMLALKVALAGVTGAPTLIFDEIDTGTGGAVADAIGQRLALLGEKLQVLVVTHLPQVAARGSEHLRISKEQKKSATFTRVERLDNASRKEELARMLAGAEVTQEARQAAGKLLEVAGR